MDEGPREPPHTEASQAPAAKVKRTYGRKREGVDASLGTSNTVASSPTRLEHPEESSSLYSLPSDGLSLNNASDTFGWKERLILFDKQFDEEEGLVSSRFTRCTADDRANKDDISVLSTSTEDESSGLRDEPLFSASAPPFSSQSDPPSPGPSNSTVARRKLSRLGSGSHEPEELSEGTTPHRIATQGASTGALESEPFGILTYSEDGHKFIREGRPTPSASPQGNGTLVELDEAKRGKTIRKSRNGKSKHQTNKIKKLSKKEENESKKAHARMMADQQVSITKRAERYTVEHLLRSVQQRQLLSEVKLPVASSDPIQEFTSSPMIGSEVEHKAGASHHQGMSEDDMPDVLQPLEARSEERQQAKHGKSLDLVKQRALEALKVQASPFDSDSDDLEVVADVKGSSVELPKSPTALEKRLANVAGFRIGDPRHGVTEVLGNSQGEAALKVAAKSAFTDRETRRPRATLDHRDLQTAMLSKATKQSIQLTKEKEEEWKRRGGRLAEKHRAGLSYEPLSLENLAENLALQKQRVERNNDQGTEFSGTDLEDDGDGDWQPEGSDAMSPSSHHGFGMPRNDEGELEGIASEVYDKMTNDETASPPDEHNETAEEDEGLGRRARKARRSANLLVVSDSEGEEADQRRGIGRVLVPETSLILGGIGQGSEPPSEGGLDEENKENNTPPALDGDDDKENTMLFERGGAIRPYFRNRQRSGTFSPDGGDRQLPLSPIADAENDAPQSSRKPLQARRMSDLDDALFFRSPSSATSPKTPRSKGTLSAVSSPVSLRPAFDGIGGGFTQLFNEEEGLCMDAPSTGVLQPAFRLHGRNEAPRQVKLGLGFNSPETKKLSKDFMGNTELSLTLDTKLQPALEVTTQIRRRADAVFEKEQDFLMEEASTSATSSRSKQELYISENGLLTQTRPEDSTPLVYRSWTFSRDSVMPRSQVADLPPSTTKRLPLSTLSLDGDTISPSQQRLTRLLKGKGRAGSSDGGILSPSSPNHQSNAFTKMLVAARKQSKREKKKFVKSDFVEGEAVESDEDEMFGFGKPTGKDDDEESDGDQPDAVVENLLDDTIMGAQELAEDKVFEKVKEHLEEDDATLEKYHRAAIEGKFRGKRRGGGIAMNDSESDEEDDDEARRLRRRMHKKRRIQGDKLEDLKKNEKSRAFYEAYQRDIQEEDNDDFAHLAGDDMDEGEDDGDEEPETVSVTAVREQLREVARQSKSGQERPLFDSEDVSWADHNIPSDDEFQIKEIDDQLKRTAARRPAFGRMDIPELDDALPRKPSRLSEEQVAQLAAWRKEQSGRNLDTGGMRGAITVTGHGSRVARRNTGFSLKDSSSRQQDNRKQPIRRKVTKASSVLASVSDRHGRFAP